MQSTERNTEWKRDYRANKRELGLCTECSNKAQKGRILCTKHLEINRLYVQNRRKKLKLKGNK